LKAFHNFWKFLSRVVLQGYRDRILPDLDASWRFGLAWVVARFTAEAGPGRGRRSDSFGLHDGV